ncbi:uncharacterized protein LOC141697969 [Apium graveolens]|uniref:uncharacterized protein LOC141697969 n=1 Tax=Apium graveolens TaxID=4045 RepID=UPI003D7B4CAF
MVRKGGMMAVVVRRIIMIVMNGGKDDNGVRGQSSGASGGGKEGSRTGAREASNEGGRKYAKRRRRRRLRDDEENSECLLWDDEGRQIFPVGLDSDPRSHMTRGYSPGRFGTYPAVAKVARIGGYLIDCLKSLRNLLAIIHMFWADGCVGIKKIDRKSPGFWNMCIDEFLRYYTWDLRFAAEARASILVHMRDNMRPLLTHLPRNPNRRNLSTSLHRRNHISQQILKIDAIVT